MGEDRLDPFRFVREALSAQRSVLNSVKLMEQTRVGQSVLTAGALDPLARWREVSAGLYKPAGVNSIAAAVDPWKNVRSVMATADIQNVSSVMIDWPQLQAALAIPTNELFDLTALAIEGAQEPLTDLKEAVEQDAAPDAPRLLSDWLLWLPTGAQARLAILALAAMYAVIEAIATEADLEHPDPHVTTIVFALAAIVAFLEGVNRLS
jgi:hypothetical protein